MEPIIAFTKVALPFGWLGNMAPYPVTYGGKTWRTTEALFQALRFDDQEIREAIRQKASAMAAKMIAKKHKASMVVEPRISADLDNMRLVLRLKLQVHPSLAARLLATGAAQLVEDCSNLAHSSGLFWGPPSVTVSGSEELARPALDGVARLAPQVGGGAVFARGHETSTGVDPPMTSPEGHMNLLGYRHIPPQSGSWLTVAPPSGDPIAAGGVRAPPWSGIGLP